MNNVAHYAELLLDLTLAGRGEMSVAQQELERAASSPLRRVRANTLVLLSDLIADTNPPVAERH